MHHKYCGKALIFNHVNFQIKELQPRAGTELDSFNLEASLKKLGFDVIVYVDLSLDELNKAIDYCTYTYIHTIIKPCLYNIYIITYKTVNYIFRGELIIFGPG